MRRFARMLVAVLLTLLVAVPPALARLKLRPAVLHGGTWNAEHKRDPRTVARQARHMLRLHDLDFLLVEEAQGYWRAFGRIRGYDTIVERGLGETDNVILVRHALAHGPGFAHQVTTHGFWLGGRWTREKYVTTVVVAGWARLTVGHQTPWVRWRNGQITASRHLPFLVRTYKQHDRRLIAWYRHRRREQVLAEDWNAENTWRGDWTPAWLAVQLGMRVHAPNASTHARHQHPIDYPMGRGLAITNVHRIGRYGSDHHAVLFTLHRR